MEKGTTLYALRIERILRKLLNHAGRAIFRPSGCAPAHQACQSLGCARFGTLENPLDESCAEIRIIQRMMKILAVRLAPTSTLSPSRHTRGGAVKGKSSPLVGEGDTPPPPSGENTGGCPMQLTTAQERAYDRRTTARAGALSSCSFLHSRNTWLKF